MASLFISYSRKDIAFARKITPSFEGLGLDFWIDWEGIPPTVDWWREIERGIEEADVFLFLLSPDSGASKVCKQEIDHAVKNGKRLIPVVVRDIKGDEAPTEFKPLNWIFLRESDEFDGGLRKIIMAVKTDYDWVQSHRQLQVKSLEWERNGRENGFLLHEKELQDAELQLVANSSKDPSPTELQREYVLKSRQIATQRSRTTTTSIVAGLIAVTILAVYGFIQAGQARTAQATAVANAETAQAASTLAVHNQELADERTNIAVARNAAITSVTLRNTQPAISFLLGIEANHRLNNYETQGILLDNLRLHPQILRFNNDHDFNEKVCHQALSADPIGLVVSRATSSDCNLAAYGDQTGIIEIWDLKNQSYITSFFTEINIPVTSLAFSKDGKRLAAGTNGGEVNMWDVDQKTLLHGPVYVEDFVTNLVFSNNGEYLAIAQSSDNFIGIYKSTLEEIYEPDIGSPYPRLDTLHILRGHSDYINTLAFGPDDTLLASGGADGKVILWDWANFRDSGEINSITLLGHNEGIERLEFSKDGKSLISTGEKGDHIVWAVESQNPIEKTYSLTDGIENLTFSPDGKTLAYQSYYNDHIIIINLPIPDTDGFLDDFERYMRYDHNGNVYVSQARSLSVLVDQFMTISPDNNLLTYEAGSGSFTLWDSSTLQSTSHPFGKVTGVTNGRYSPDGKLFAVGDDQGLITLFSTGSDKTVATLRGHTAGIQRLEFSLDGKLLASVDQDKKIIVWDLKSQKPMGDPLESNGVIALNPHGRMLAFGNADGVPIFFDLTEYKIIGEPLKAHTGVYRLSFSSDGSILASSGYDSGYANDPRYNNIILWDVASRKQIGQTIHSFIEGGGPSLFSGISGMFDPDGNTLVSYDNLGNITLWNISRNAWIERSCNIVGRNFTKEEWATYFPDEEYHKTCEQWPAGE